MHLVNQKREHPLWIRD